MGRIYLLDDDLYREEKKKRACNFENGVLLAKRMGEGGGDGLWFW